MALMVRGSFGDLFDVRFREVNAERELLKRNTDMVPVLWRSKSPTTPWRADERFSEISGLGRAPQFTGAVDYAQRYQGYDVTGAYVEFAQGMQVERTLVEYDQFDEIDDMARNLFDSLWHRRQFDALRFYRNAFSVDTFFYNHSEGVAPCSNSHTTTTGVSTASGFDNLVTTALSAANLWSMQLQAQGFRDLQGLPTQTVIDTIYAPKDLGETAFEIINSMGKVDSAQNNPNVHKGAYTLVLFPDNVNFTDANDWFGCDSNLKEMAAFWFDQVWPGGQPEFGQAEEFDTYNAKYRAYGRWMYLVRKWQWLIGAQVS